MDGQLGRVWAGQQADGADEVEQRVIAHPASPDHDLLAHHRDVGGGATERGQAELEEQGGQLGEVAARVFCGVWSGHDGSAAHLLDTPRISQVRDLWRHNTRAISPQAMNQRR